MRRLGLMMCLACALLGSALVAAASAAPSSPGTSTLPLCPASRWVEAWEAAPSDSDSVGDARLTPFVHGPEQTLRMIITPHYGGSQVRVRLSNTFGSAPVTVTSTAIAASQGGAALVTGSSVPVLFNGAAAVTIPAGGEVTSDPVQFTFTAFENLAVSMYLAGTDLTPTEHFTGRQISYGTAPLAGNHVSDTAAGAFTETTTARYLLAGLDAEATGNAGTVVTFGDSITDGYQGGPSLVPEVTSTLNLNGRYPDWLARRLLAAGAPLSVANAGISGNRILQNGQIPMFGPSGISRFSRDALEIPGVSTIIILEGTNDIGQSDATASQIIAGLTQLVDMAKAAHVRVLLGTLTPMIDAGEPGTYSGSAPNATRLAVNAWIRSQQIADGYVDFAAAVADPANPDTMAPAYNGGDGLHFTPAGYQAMANAVNLAQLQGPSCSLGQLRITVSPRAITSGRRTRVRIRVTAPSGQPVSGAQITLGTRHARTNSAGRAVITLKLTRPGRVTLRASAAAYTARTVKIRVLKPATRPGG